MQIKMFKTHFQIVKANPSNVQGSAFAYRKQPRIVMLEAASDQPGDILAVLNADLPALGAGEAYEILSTEKIPGTGDQGNIIYS
jgi:hypothetical protein